MKYSSALLLSLLAATAGAAPPFVPHGTPIDEAYRGQFGTCDATDRFGTVQFPIRKANGKIAWYGCKSDPSRLVRLERIAADGDVPAAVIWESKIAHDLDGSPAACNTPGTTDQCPTTLMLKPTTLHPCPKVLKGTRPDCLPVDASKIAYAVMPAAAPKGIDGTRFAKLTGLRVGDIGVVIANGKVVPAIIADTGPAYKIGEGSTALLAALSSDGKPRTLARGVVFVMFPGSSLGKSPNPDTLADQVAAKGLALYQRLPRSP